MPTLDHKAWNNFVLSAPDSTFLHSWEWGQLQEYLHVPYWRLSIEQEGKVQVVVLVIKRELPLGRSWLYIPRGPVFSAGLTAAERSELWPQLEQQVHDLAIKQRALFVRLDPAWNPDRAHELTTRGWAKAEREVQPRDTLIVDLNQSEEDLLRTMHAKTRYNIKVARKHNVQVRFTTEAAGIETFLRLAREVQGRAGFHYHPDSYYRAMHAVLSAAGQLEVALAEAEHTPLAAHLLISFGDTVTYAHGASSSAQRKLMAPQLLQWESMKRAQAAGKAHYDFFGVAPAEADSAHPWAGITRFKEGFGGRREHYVGTFDLILDRVGYLGFTVARRLHKLWR